MAQRSSRVCGSTEEGYLGKLILFSAQRAYTNFIVPTRCGAVLATAQTRLATARRRAGNALYKREARCVDCLCRATPPVRCNPASAVRPRRMLGEHLWGGAPLGPSPGGGESGEGGGGTGGGEGQGEGGGCGDGGEGGGGFACGGGGVGSADAALVVAAVDAKQWKELLNARGWLDRSRRPATFAALPPDTGKHLTLLGRPAAVAFPVLPGAVDTLRARVCAHGVTPLPVQASTSTFTARAGAGEGEAAGVGYPGRAVQVDSINAQVGGAYGLSA
jgi:hypothetical protein